MRHKKSHCVYTLLYRTFQPYIILYISLWTISKEGTKGWGSWPEKTLIFGYYVSGVVVYIHSWMWFTTFRFNTVPNFEHVQSVGKSLGRIFRREVKFAWNAIRAKLETNLTESGCERKKLERFYEIRGMKKICGDGNVIFIPLYQDLMTSNYCIVRLIFLYWSEKPNYFISVYVLYNICGAGIILLKLLRWCNRMTPHCIYFTLNYRFVSLPRRWKF